MSTSNSQTDHSPTCPRCAATLPADAPGGLCPRCLMEAPLETEPATASQGAALPSPDLTSEEFARLFPQLEVLECLGRGGMGVVYKARQKSLDRTVALKLLAPERIADPAFAARFEKEARALARLNHPHIVTIHDFGSVFASREGTKSQEHYYLLMEFVDGVNLRQAMEAGRFTPEQALAVVPPICDALQYAHDEGIVHRDIKPENLLLDKDGRIKIADFGIAKIIGGTEATVNHPSDSQAEATIAGGTPRYMAPEQGTEPDKVDHRSDIYSLGAVLYELLTGQAPEGTILAPSAKLEIDVRLDHVVLRALERAPERRYQTAGEFRTQVETVIQNPKSSLEHQSADPVAAASPSALHKLLGTAAAILLAIIACAAVDGLNPATEVAIPQTDPIRFDSVATIVALSGIGLSLVMLALCIPLALRKVPMNALYGIRTSHSFASEARWYDLNENGGLQFIKGAIAILVVGGVGLWIPQHRADSYAICAVLVWLAAIAIPAFHLIGSGSHAPNKPRRRSKGHKLLMSIAFAVPIAFLIKSFVLETFTVIGPAAAPEIPEGSWVVATKLRTTFGSGDIIIYRDKNNRHHTGRVRGSKDGHLLIERQTGSPWIEIKRGEIDGKVVSVLWRASSEPPFGEPLGSTSLLRDSSHKDLEQAMIATLSPGSILLAELVFVDERHSVAITYPSAGFWMSSLTSKTFGKKFGLQLRPSPDKLQAILEFTEPYRHLLKLPYQPEATSYAQPSDPSKAPPLHIPPNTQWRNSEAERIFYFAPEQFAQGEWKEGTWNDLPIFELWGPDETKLGELRWRLLVIAADDSSRLPSTEPIIQKGPWHASSWLESRNFLSRQTIQRLRNQNTQSMPE